MTSNILHQVVSTSPVIFFIYYHLMEMTYWTAPYLYVLYCSITEFSTMSKLVTFIKVPKSKWSVSTDWVCREEWTPKGIKTQKVDRGCVPAQTPPAISYSSKNVSIKQYCIVLYCIYYAFVKSIQGLIPIGCRTCLRIIQRYLG